MFKKRKQKKAKGGATWGWGRVNCVSLPFNNTDRIFNPKYFTGLSI